MVKYNMECDSMGKIYNLNFDNHIFKGIFINDSEFGFFFFTENCRKKLQLTALFLNNIIFFGLIFFKEKKGAFFWLLKFLQSESI